MSQDDSDWYIAGSSELISISTQYLLLSFRSPHFTPGNDDTFVGLQL